MGKPVVGDEFLYQSVHRQLRARIEQGDYPVDQALPPPPVLCADFSVSAITIKRALDMLQNEGFVVRRPRHGTVVVTTNPSPRRSLRSERDDDLPLFGVLLTNFDDTFGAGILAGIVLSTNGRANPILKLSLGDAAAEARLIQEIVQSGAHGLIFEPNSSAAVPPALLSLLAASFPVVVLDRSIEGVPVSTVCSDNRGAARRATEHLYECGHRAIGLVTSAGTVSTIRDRRDGYIAAHAALHLAHTDADEFADVRSVVPGSMIDPAEDVAALVRFLQSRPALTGFLVSEHHVATLLREALGRLGRTVPADASIVCFDQPPTGADPSVFRFTHIAQPQRLIGSRAVDLLFDQFARPGSVDQVLLPADLVVGESSGSPPR